MHRPRGLVGDRRRPLLLAAGPPRPGARKRHGPQAEPDRGRRGRGPRQGAPRRPAPKRDRDGPDRHGPRGPRVRDARRGQQRALPLVPDDRRRLPRLSRSGPRQRFGGQLRGGIFPVPRGGDGARGADRSRGHGTGGRCARPADPRARELRRAFPGGHVRGRPRRGLLGERGRAQRHARLLQPQRPGGLELGRDRDRPLRRRVPEEGRPRARGAGRPREPRAGAGRRHGGHAGADRGPRVARARGRPRGPLRHLCGEEGAGLGRSRRCSSPGSSPWR